MRPTQVINAIRVARLANRPVMLWGKPGIGKTSIFRYCAELDKVEFRVWELPLMDSVDLRGCPSIDKGLTRFNPPADLPRKGTAGYLCLDEIAQAMISTTNAATRLILEGRLGEYELPGTWWVCAAGNREEDMAAVNRMPTHVANRFLHITMDVNSEDWVEWAERSDIDPRVIAFLKYRPEMLHVFEPRSKEKAFASPRTWEFMSQIFVAEAKAGEEQPKWESAERMELAAGIVGVQAATEFVGFLRIMNKLVDIDALLLSPSKVAVPKDAAILYALTYALAERCTRKNFGAIIEYIDRLSREFGFLFMKRIDTKNPELKKSKEFISWVAKNQKLV